MRSTRLEQIAKVLEKLPLDVGAGAFELFDGYVTERSAGPRTKTKDTKSQPRADVESEEGFFASFPHDKPADNGKPINACLYREYGAEPFTSDEVRAQADAVGITIPARST